MGKKIYKGNVPKKKKYIWKMLIFWFGSSFITFPIYLLRVLGFGQVVLLTILIVFFLIWFALIVYNLVKYCRTSEDMLVIDATNLHEARVEIIAYKNHKIYQVQDYFGLEKENSSFYSEMKKENCSFCSGMKKSPFLSFINGEKIEIGFLSEEDIFAVNEELLRIKRYALETPKALPIPPLTGDYCKDLVRIAHSQVGYKAGINKETRKKYAIYGDWSGQHGCEWCSEFVAWCAAMADIPTSIIPRCLDSRLFVNAFFKMGGYYILEENKYHAENCRVCKGDQYITLKDIKPGDIIIMETNGIWSDGSDHTGLCVEAGEKEIITIEGNYDNSVVRVSRGRDSIHGICRPVF